MKDLQTKLQEIDAKAEQEKANIILQNELSEKTGIPVDNIIIYSSNRVCFGWRTPLGKEDVKKLSKLFPVNGTNYEVRFASGSKNFFTDSPLVVKWENSDLHHPKEFKIQYTSGNLNIEIRVPESHFSSHIYSRTRDGKHKGFGRYETFRDIFIDYFYTQSYSGGYNTLYFLEGAEKLEEYENFVFTGEFKYIDEIDK
jgi:hypothetical protein